MQWNPNDISAPLLHPPVWRSLVHGDRIRYNKIRSKHLHAMLDDQRAIEYNHYFHFHATHTHYHYIAFLGSRTTKEGYPLANYLLVSLDANGRGYMAVYSIWNMSQTCINSVTFDPMKRDIETIVQSGLTFRNIQRLLDTKINTEQATVILNRGRGESRLNGFQKFRGTDIDMILSLAYAGTGIEEIRGTGMALYVSILDHAERIRFTKKRSLAIRVKQTIPSLEYSRYNLASLIIKSGT
jgi:hypothetical protein